jgi:peptidoglycan hydrolase-like protein with peptidoglycan-binding domain
MNLQTIIAAITGLVSLASTIKGLWDSSAGFAAIGHAVSNSPAVKAIEELGASMFPAAAKEIQKVLAAIHLGYPDATKWVQKALNAGETLGFVSFGAPLVVDGIFGPKTMAAVRALQTKLRVPTTGAVADAEYAALNLLLNGKLPT